jgi:hypothetical protein
MDNKVVEFQSTQNQSLSIIDNVNLQQIQGTIQKIGQFQGIVQKTLHQNHDFGVIPGTPKPTLLKPGAEKILMLLGLRSEFEVADSTRDFHEGFFQYQVRCKLYKNDVLITEGLGACNTKERKYIKQDPFTMDNTVLKMAKKRALIDATLLVASLSDVFTQDIEDMDLSGEQIGKTPSTTFDSEETISKAQAKRLFALSNGNADLCKRVATKYGYKKSDDIKKIDYEKIAKEVEAEAKKIVEGSPYEHLIQEDEIPM